MNNLLLNFISSLNEYKFHALILLALFLFNQTASASCTAGGGGAGTCTEEGEAAQWVADKANRDVACEGSGGYSYGGTLSYSGEGVIPKRISFNSFTCVSGHIRSINATYSNDCTSRNTTSTARLSFAGPFPSCRSYCQVDFNGSDVQQSTVVTSLGTTTLTTGVIQYTGSTCNIPITQQSSTPQEPAPEANADATQSCVSVGTLTQCQRTDGQMCATASNGTQLCWAANSPTAQAAPDGSIAVSPSTSPPTTPQGSTPTGETATTETVINNGGSSTTVNTTVNTYTNSGTCGAGQTGTPPNCSDVDDGGGDGTAGDPLGDNYDPKGKTIGSIGSNFLAEVGDTPIVGSVSNFLDLSGLGAECPMFQLDLTDTFIGSVITIEAFCDPKIIMVMQWVGIVILCFAVVKAFFIATG